MCTYISFISGVGFLENSSCGSLWVWVAHATSVCVSAPVLSVLPRLPAVRSVTEELMLHLWGLGRGPSGLLGTRDTCHFIFPKCEAHDAWRQTAATVVGARATAESGPVFINLPAPGTKQSVCSWPNVIPAMPAEIELDRLERSWHVGVHIGDGGRASAVRKEPYRVHRDRGAVVRVETRGQTVCLVLAEPGPCVAVLSLGYLVFV